MSVAKGAAAVPSAQPHKFLSYGRQLIEEDDIAAVTAALQGDYLTTGPLVPEFERTLASHVGARETIACSSGTAALYLAARALGLGPGHRVVVPAITFAATASAPHLAGAEIIFADVDPESGLMRACDLEAALSGAPDGKADAVFPVHYAGQSCDMEAIAAIARPRGMKIVEDAAHALGTVWMGPHGALTPLGANAHADLSIFSFHPVKTIAMGEGGAVAANDSDLIDRLRRERNHGLTREGNEFIQPLEAFDSTRAVNPWYYEVQAPGFNFRISDINCALGLSQLKKLRRFVELRRTLVACYDEMLAPLHPIVKRLKRETRSATAWHLYAVRIDFEQACLSRAALMRALAADGIGIQVHYIPVNRHPYYRARYGAMPLPGADAFYTSALSLPLHAAMSERDIEHVTGSLKRHLGVR